MLLPRIDVNHFSKALFNFSYVPVFTLRHFSDEFWKDSKNPSLFFFQVARVLPGILKWFATPLLGIPFSSSFYVRTLLSKSLHDVHFCGHFYRVSQPQSNSNKFKDFKTFEYYDIRIETFELTTVAYRRMKELVSKTKIRITWWKIRPGNPKLVRFKWFFELCEFELKEVSCKCLLVNSVGTKEFVRFRWSFELQEFELHEFNCS